MSHLNLADLPIGYVFGPIEFTVSEQDAADYITATGGTEPSPTLNQVVHPLQLDAVAIANLINALGIVENRIETIHAGQQMTVTKTVAPGDTVVCTSTLKSNNMRRESRWATIASHFAAADGTTIAETTSTLILLPQVQ